MCLRQIRVHDDVDEHTRGICWLTKTNGPRRIRESGSREARLPNVFDTVSITFLFRFSHTLTLQIAIQILLLQARVFPKRYISYFSSDLIAALAGL